MYFTVCYTVFRANKNSKIKMKKTNQPYYNIRNSKGRYSSKRLYNLNHFIIFITTLLISIASVYAYSFVNNYVKEKNYNECYKQYEGANFISCDTDEYFVYRAEETPVKTPKTAPVSVVNTKSDTECNPSENVELNKLLVKYFKNCKDVKTIWAIAQAESSGKQLAVNKGNTNKSWDCGYMQNNTIHKKAGETKEQFCERMFNLEENIATAHKIYKEAGNKFTPWVTFNKNLHVTYLK